MSSILIKNIGFRGDTVNILIRENRIAEVVSVDESVVDEKVFDKVIDGTGKRVIPSFANGHTHGAMTLLRGYREDMMLHEWLRDIWVVEGRLTPEMCYWGTKLACLEMIKSGTTVFNDMYFALPETYKAVNEMGIRAVLSEVALDGGDPVRAEKQKRVCERMYEVSQDWSDLVEYCVGIHAPYTVSKDMMVWVSKYARERGLLIHTHISETEKEYNDYIEQFGMSPVAYMDSLGVLGEDVVAAHCLWLTEDDMDIFAKRGVKVIHNINSNLKLASGYQFRYKELKDRGVLVGLGTDGCSSSNNLDMLEAMKRAALVQKGWNRDPRLLPIDELMDMASLNGYKALRIDGGKIEKGVLADMVLIDTNSPAFIPDINFESNLIYAANSSCVDTVICNGKVVMENRIVPGEEEILSNVKRILPKLYETK